MAFLATAWEQVQAEQELAEVFPDTFVHPAIREGMGAAPAPGGAAARLGYWCFETMTPLVAGTYPAARAAVDVALTAADLVLDGARAAYGLCRPPGHHAPRAAYGGYCYFNNAAVVADEIVARTGTKVTVLDVDYHHGNGTQQIFYERDDVQYVSLHGDPNRAYPYFAGYADERGSGRGLGATVNLPLAPGTDDEAYLGAGWPTRSTPSTGSTPRRWSSPSASTPSTSTRSPTSCSPPTALPSPAALVAELGRPMSILQEGGYHVATIGENVRTWLAAFDDTAAV